MGGIADKHLPPKARDHLPIAARMAHVIGKGSSKARRKQASDVIVTICLPSRLISWFEPRLPLLPLQLSLLHTLLRLVPTHLL